MTSIAPPTPDNTAPPPPKTLFAIVQDLLALRDRANKSLFPDLDPDPDAPADAPPDEPYNHALLLHDYMQYIVDGETALEMKAEAYRHVMEAYAEKQAGLQGEIDYLLGRVKVLKARQQSYSTHIEQLQQGLLEAMQVLGYDRLPAGPLYEWRVTMNPASVVILPNIKPAQLPKRFQRVTIEPDKIKLKTALTQADPIALTLAKLERKPRISLKVTK